MYREIDTMITGQILIIPESKIQKNAQISCKYKPVPIGIKYSVNDPFKSKNEQNKEEFIIYRRQLEGHTKENLEDIENQQSKKINILNILYYFYYSC